MSAMGEWLNGLHMRIPEGEERIPIPAVDLPGGVTRTPDVPSALDPTTSAPVAPASGVSPALQAWLISNRSGHNVLTDEMYDYYNGDEILRQIQQFDPNARWVASALGGGEGGISGTGRRLDFDVTKLPAVGGPGGGQSIFDSGLVPMLEGADFFHGDMMYDDPYYGRLTPVQNVKKQGNTLETMAPYIAAAISLGGPALAGALLAGGIGAGVATGAVTGSGVAAAAGGSPWWATALSKAPTIAKATSTHDYSGGSWAPPVGGSAPKTGPSSNESSLVANDFADDPYGFSRRGFG